jgi:rare lipoprotein A
MAALFTGTPTIMSAQSDKPIKASFYADAFEGRPMAAGGKFHQRVQTAASRQFPLGTTVHVVSTKTGKSIDVLVTDKGPWCKKFSLDLSKAAFRALGLSPAAGWGWVTVSTTPKILDE